MNSIFPQWWNTAITVYNRYTDPLTDITRWYRTTIPNCFWRYSSDKVTLGDSVLESNNTICRIPENSKFLERYVWENLTNDQLPNYFTLGVGDLIVKGTVTDVLDETLKNHRSTDLINKYKKLQGIMQIELVQINTGGGRNNPHYFVKGV